MKKVLFKTLATFNRLFLPSLGKMDLNNLTKTQKVLVAYKYWVTINALD